MWCLRPLSIHASITSQVLHTITYKYKHVGPHWLTMWTQPYLKAPVWDNHSVHSFILLNIDNICHCWLQWNYLARTLFICNIDNKIITKVINHSHNTKGRKEGRRKFVLESPRFVSLGFVMTFSRLQWMKHLVKGNFDFPKRDQFCLICIWQWWFNKKTKNW